MSGWKQTHPSSLQHGRGSTRSCTSLNWDSAHWSQHNSTATVTCERSSADPSGSLTPLVLLSSSTSDALRACHLVPRQRNQLSYWGHPGWSRAQAPVVVQGRHLCQLPSSRLSHLDGSRNADGWPQALTSPIRVGRFANTRWLLHHCILPSSQ